MWEELLSITIQVRVGGVIVIDNVLWHGRVADPLVKYTLTLPRTSFFNNLKFLSQLLFLVQVNDSKTLSIRNFNRKLMEDDRVSISMVCRQTSLIPSSSSWRKKKKKKWKEKSSLSSNLGSDWRWHDDLSEKIVLKTALGLVYKEASKQSFNFNAKAS